MNFVPVLVNVLKKVIKNNRENPGVKTADPVVFEELKKKFEKVEPLDAKNGKEDILEKMKRRVAEAKVENEVNPDVETADGSVYESIMKEIEKIKNHSGPTSGNEPIGNQTSYEPPIQNSIMQAVTNSSGGSLQIRERPDMGAPIHQTIRIPDDSLLTVLEYSNNKINLDGKLSRFALVEYKGIRGWILENYLNFN